MGQEALNNLGKFLPELTLTITILAVILVDLFFKKRTQITAYISIAGIAVTFIFTLLQNGMIPQAVFTQMIVIDPFGYFFKMLLILSSFLIIIFSLFSDEVRNSEYRVQEYYALILSLTLGGFLMASSVNLLMVYLSLELVSLSSYILSGYLKKSKRATEAALKYVIYGGVSSGLMLFGISMLYGMTGTTDLYAINAFLLSKPINLVTLLISVILILAGFGYKISAVPFHFWAPDVYEGSTTPITAFLSVSSKAAGFAMMLRFFIITFKSPMDAVLQNTPHSFMMNFHWTEIIAVIAVATMVLGNFVAVWQDNLKRLLAYSSIAQAGYMLLGLVVFNNQGVAAILTYLAVYLFMNLGAFFCAIMILNKFKTESIEEMKGLGYSAPFLCVSMGIFMFSLSGIPLTAGFVGKFYIFSALINNGYIWLAIIGLLNSVVSLYFYIKIIKNMFLVRPAKEKPEMKFSFSYNFILLILIIPTIFLGVYFTPLTKFAEYSVQIFGLK